MTVDDLNMALEPVIQALEYQAQVNMGIILGIGILVGVLLISLFFDPFDR